jgi:DNA-binding MarR family transcriptional regulator
MVNRFLALEAGTRLQQSRPEVHGGWATLGELLSGAARSTGRAAIPALLRGTQGRGREILELLAAEAGRPVRRSKIKKTLDLTEAQLSHLLHDLEEADLIIRYRLKGTKEVLVELGSAGREVVAQSGLSKPASALPAPDAPPGDGPPLAKVIQIEKFRKKVSALQEDGVSRYEEMRTFEASLPARALFSTRAASS